MKTNMDLSELLELAAKAAGVPVEWRNNPDECGFECLAHIVDGVFQEWWIPLEDDGDSLRLAVELQMDIIQDERSISIKKWHRDRCESILLVEQPIDGSRSVSTRIAIVQAAAVLAEQP